MGERRSRLVQTGSVRSGRPRHSCIARSGRPPLLPALIPPAVPFPATLLSPPSASTLDACSGAAADAALCPQETHRRPRANKVHRARVLGGRDRPRACCPISFSTALFSPNRSRLLVPVRHASERRYGDLWRMSGAVTHLQKPIPPAAFSGPVRTPAPSRCPLLLVLSHPLADLSCLLAECPLCCFSGSTRASRDLSPVSIPSVLALVVPPLRFFCIWPFILRVQSSRHWELRRPREQAS